MWLGGKLRMDSWWGVELRLGGLVGWYVEVGVVYPRLSERNYSKVPSKEVW